MRGFGSKNYTSAKVNSLLDCVENNLLLGYQEWTIVTNNFAKWAEQNEIPQRDLQRLNVKFDKLANAKKTSSHCPPAVCRAKIIAKQMESMCVAASLGVENASQDSGSTIDLVRNDDSLCIEEQKLVGQRRSSRALGAEN